MERRKADELEDKAIKLAHKRIVHLRNESNSVSDWNTYRPEINHVEAKSTARFDRVYRRYNIYIDDTICTIDSA